MPDSRAAAQFQTLLDIIARLRSQNGCPWDREQTHQSLREFVLEESYEVLEALDEGDTGKLCGELGDLLLQIVLQAQIAREASEFEIADVLMQINQKLVYRHPHVFGATAVKDANEVAHNWEQLKQKERGEVSILASVPKNLPALAYSQDIQRRVAEAGFDWKDESGVIAKLTEEIREFQTASNPDQQSAEFGDIIFTLANIARRMNIDLETATREANRKFYRRFTKMEEVCRQGGLKFSQLTFDEQNQLWEEAKKLTP